MGVRHFRDHGKRRTLMSCVAELNCDDEHPYFKSVDQFIVEMDPQSGCTWIDPSRHCRQRAVLVRAGGERRCDSYLARMAQPKMVGLLRLDGDHWRLSHVSFC